MPAVTLNYALRFPAYRGNGPPDAFLAQVQLAACAQGWAPAETAVRVALSLEGEALKVLEDLLPVLLLVGALQGALQRRFGRCVSQESLSE